MKFDAKFISSFASFERLPTDGKPEIAFIGRSNVGKSSLINAITERKNLAKTSSTPGKTQLLNYFSINGDYYLVDMPGYGYAKTSKEKRMDWAKLTDEYFRKRKSLRAVGVLVDSRHSELESDVMVVEWLAEQEIPFFLVLTKTDKPTQSEVSQHERLLRQNVVPALGIFKTSSEKGRGIRELREFVSNLAVTTRNSEPP
jgi:GTP-binding protein